MDWRELSEQNPWDSYGGQLSFEWMDEDFMRSERDEFAWLRQRGYTALFPVATTRGYADTYKVVYRTYRGRN